MVNPLAAHVVHILGGTATLQDVLPIPIIPNEPLDGHGDNVLQRNTAVRASLRRHRAGQCASETIERIVL